MRLLQDKVKVVLSEYPLSRDNDNFLVAKIWENETVLSRVSVWEFFYDMSEGVYTSYDSITRLRRKIQNECPDLRGTKYAERHAVQKEHQTALGYLNKII